MCAYVCVFVCVCVCVCAFMTCVAVCVHTVYIYTVHRVGLNFPDKANLSAILSHIPLLKNTRSEGSFMESRKKHLEKYLHVRTN